MYALTVTVEVNADQIDAFMAETMTQIRSTRQEPGNIYYEVLQSEEDRSLFIIFETYQSPDAFALHRTAPHCIRWKAITEPMLRQPRTVIRGTLLELL